MLDLVTHGKGGRMEVNREGKDVKRIEEEMEKDLLVMNMRVGRMV